MSMLQIRTESEKKPVGTQARKLKSTQVFKRANSNDPFIRVKPVNYLLNSSLICDKLNRGDPLVVNLALGTLYFIDGEEIVESVSSAILKIED